MTVLYVVMYGNFYDIQGIHLYALCTRGWDAVAEMNIVYANCDKKLSVDNTGMIN